MVLCAAAGNRKMNAEDAEGEGKERGGKTGKEG
jgi:hypothetical protein